MPVRPIPEEKKVSLAQFVSFVREQNSPHNAACFVILVASRFDAGWAMVPLLNHQGEAWQEKFWQTLSEIFCKVYPGLEIFEKIERGIKYGESRHKTNSVNPPQKILLYLGNAREVLSYLEPCEHQVKNGTAPRREPSEIRNDFFKIFLQPAN